MIEYSDWKISARGTAEPQVTESLFAQSNGYLGARASFLVDGALPHERCAYLAGGFEYIAPGVTDMVNLPDLFHVTWKLGERVSIDRSLNLFDGLYTREAVYRDTDGRETAVTLKRFISMSDKHVAGLSVELTALNYDGETELTMELDGSTVNLPVHDDQTVENLETVALLTVAEAYKRGNVRFLRAESKSFAVEMTAVITGGLALRLERGKPSRVEKLIFTNAAPYDTDFNTAFKLSAEAWAKRWETSDIQIDANIETQTALRYNIFQLMQNRPFDDPSVSIGARGLTHSRYKGCYFWDTDIFLLPFYISTDPNAARNLIKFRLDNLGGARANAKALNLSGARYPWMCSVGGREQCHTWDVGRSEVHITADVAYAADNYVNVTGDKSLNVAQLYAETARYWASRFSYDARKDVYNLLFIKGPDEYCGVSANNAFTVFMARHNLQLAIDANPSHPEVGKWREIIAKSRVIYDDGRQLYIQDEDFLRLEPFPGRISDDGSAAYHEYEFDRLQRYKILKQADLVHLIVLLPELFDNEEKRAIWDCYEPLTLHDSSLSWGIHALAAAKLGLKDSAYVYFERALTLDLSNRMKNTGSEGIHIGTAGSVWQTVVFGFAGLDAKNGALSPQLPEGWRGMRFSFFKSGKRYRAEITSAGHSVTEVEE
ncbi:maltose phosphorylase [Clostridia bacterium]|nr:maltose phosphorylase [Clostridia bacterium]